MITLTGAAASVTAIGGGIIVFGDPLAREPLGIVVQFLALALVVAAAVLTPAPAARRRGPVVVDLLRPPPATRARGAGLLHC